MNIDPNIKLDFDDLLIKPNRTTLESRNQVDVSREFKFYHSPRVWNGTPIFASNMGTTGSFAMARALAKNKMCVALHKYHSKEDLLDFYVSSYADPGYDILDYAWVSIGMNDDALKNIKWLCSQIKYPLNIAIDVANGHMQKFVTFCSRVRQEFPESILMAGNVCIPEMVQELLIHGEVDIVRVGISGGRNCTTRFITGVGVSMASAIDDCGHAAHGLVSGKGRLGLICADGGIRQVGDFCKSMCLNADFTMAGGFFAGHEECDGEWKYNEKGEKQSLLTYGMSTHYAQQKHGEGKRDYRASEGTLIEVKYKGPVQRTIDEVLGGIRSCCTYIGAQSIKEMPRCASFVRVNRIHDRYYFNDPKGV